MIITNGPGEVATWLVPTLRALAERSGSGRVRTSVFIPPCDFASGREREVVARLPGVTLAVGPGGYLKYLLLRRAPRSFAPGREGVVLSLGGDLAHAALLARRLGYPAFAYTEGAAGPKAAFRRYFVPDRAAARRLGAAGVEDARVTVVGDLMVDAVLGAVREGQALEVPGDGPLIALFPGSQPGEVRLMAPLLLGAALEIAAAVPAARFALGLSPFVTREQLADVLAHPDPSVSGTGGRLREDAIEVEGGTTVHLVPPSRRYALMQAATLALSQPGSITMELAVLGVPAVVALPLNNPRVIPLRGLPGVLGRVPVVGPPLRARAARRWAEGLGRFALPNLRASRELTPEVKGVLTPKAVAKPAVCLLLDRSRRELLGQALREAAGPPGAARRLLDGIFSHFRGNSLAGGVEGGPEAGTEGVQGA